MNIKQAQKLYDLLASEDYRIEISTRHDCEDIIEITYDDISEIFEFHGRYDTFNSEDIDVKQIIVTRSEYIEDWQNLEI